MTFSSVRRFSVLACLVAWGCVSAMAQVAAPRFNPAGGQYSSRQSVSISTTTSGATIRYTTNGSDPTASSPAYTSALSVSATTTVKARAFRAGQADSPVASATYTIVVPVASPTFSPGTGSYSSAQALSISTSTSGATIRYTTNGSDPTSSSPAYSSPLSISSTTTVKARAFKSGQPDSSVSSATFTINLPVATPTFSPSAGSFSAAQSVTIRTTTTGATIRYTTNGNDPTSSSTTYSSPLQISSTTTLKAKAFKTGQPDSGVATGTFTITLPVSTPRATPAAGTYSSTQSVVLSTTTAGATIRYTTNGNDPTASSTAYSSPVQISATTTLKAKAFKSGQADSGVLTAPYTITPPVATPTISPGTGSFASEQSVTLRTTTTGATIRYTTSGADPTASSQIYSSALRINSTTTVKARAYKSGSADSSVATATITITSPVATPAFSVAAGSYSSAQSVRISSATSGATIRYTTSGSDPTASSTVYSSALQVSVTTTVKAKAFKSGMTDSGVATATYTILQPVSAPKVSPIGGKYAETQLVALTTSTAGATIRYTTNGSEPTGTSTSYSAPLSIAVTTTLKARAFKTGMAESSVASASYEIIGRVAKPTLRPAGGTYTAAQTITMETATTGATIRYTTNGAEPTANSLAYSSPLLVSATTTLRAKAFRSGLSDSETGAASYVIGDAYENDNVATSAKVIENDKRQARSIHAAGDVDWVKFSLAQLSDVTIETDGSRGDTQIWLYGPNSPTKEIRNNDDKSAASDFSLIQRTGEERLEPGTYYVKVAEAGNDGAIAAYTLTVAWKESGLPSDKYETDDTIATAKPIANGETQTHSIHRVGDVDWVTFTVEAGGASNAKLETAAANGTTGSTDVAIYGPNSSTTLLARNGTEAWGSVAQESLAAGTYYVKISDRGSDATIAGYTVKVSWASGGATRLAHAQTVTGLSGRKGSQAYYQVVVPAGQKGLEVNLWGGASADVFVSRDDGKGTLPTSKKFDKRTDAVSAFNKQVLISDATPGTYYILVSGAGTFSNASLKAIVGNPPRVVLLLHGMNSSPGTWGDFLADVASEDNPALTADGPSLAAARKTGVIFDGKLIQGKPEAMGGVIYYAIDFGSRDYDGKPGLRLTGSDAGLAEKTGGTVPEARQPQRDSGGDRQDDDQDGDFSPFSGLGEEVLEAVKVILEAHPRARIALVCHSRGGLAARAFLQDGSTEGQGARDAIDGVITLGTPHLGSRLGRLYEYLRTNPSSSSKAAGDDWKFAARLDIAVDIGEPTVKMLRDNGDEIEALKNAASRLSGGVRYGGVLFDGVKFGVVELHFGVEVDIDLFSLQLTPLIDGNLGPDQTPVRLSDAAKDYVLAGSTREDENGDGIVSLKNQQWSNLSGWKYITATEPADGTDHMHETSESAAIQRRLRVMLGWGN